MEIIKVCHYFITYMVVKYLELEPRRFPIPSGGLGVKFKLTFKSSGDSVDKLKNLLRLAYTWWRSWFLTNFDINFLQHFVMNWLLFFQKEFRIKTLQLNLGILKKPILSYHQFLAAIIKCLIKLIPKILSCVNMSLMVKTKSLRW